MHEASMRHPCYNEDAHHYFARMHLAVAPKCNIRCNYCNRKYDCVSESRPGVSSVVLKPDEAVRKVLRVAEKIPQLSVVGIAGPGDPLANPEETFATFRGIMEVLPDVKLCLSTNGLLLPEHAETIRELGVNHVTVTINTIDPRIGSLIYGWVNDRGEILKGLDAAERLLERQLLGVKMMGEMGILCKVNSVLIPGVNDNGHLAEVTKKVKSLGAFVHNIMPLIISPGSEYERTGMQGPTPEELIKAQEESSGEMPLMRHCRQCRADAVGMLGDDQSTEWSEESETTENSRLYSPEERTAIQNKLEEEMLAKRQKLNGESACSSQSACLSAKPGNGGTQTADSKLRVAVATRGNGRINRHFGHAKEFLVYEVNGQTARLLGVRKVQAYCNGTASCDGEEGKQGILHESLELLKDCRILLCSGIGDAPSRILQQAGIMPLVRTGPIEETIIECAKYYQYFSTQSDQPCLT